MFVFLFVLREELKKAGLWNPPYKKDHPLWVKALEHYKKQTGDRKVSLGCGSCMNKIKNFLERE